VIRTEELKVDTSSCIYLFFPEGLMASSSPSKQALTNFDLTAAPKNSKGGVLVTDAEISAAFAFFDTDGA